MASCRGRGVLPSPPRARVPMAPGQPPALYSLPNGPAARGKRTQRVALSFFKRQQLRIHHANASSPLSPRGDTERDRPPEGAFLLTDSDTRVAAWPALAVGSLREEACVCSPEPPGSPGLCSILSPAQRVTMFPTKTRTSQGLRQPGAGPAAPPWVNAENQRGGPRLCLPSWPSRSGTHVLSGSLGGKVSLACPGCACRCQGHAGGPEGPCFPLTQP